MAERFNKIFNQRQQQREQKINEAFKRQRLDLPVDIEPIHRLTEDLIDSEGWTEKCPVGKGILYTKGNERKVVTPGMEDLRFVSPVVIYQAPKGMEKKSPEELKKNLEEHKKAKQAKDCADEIHPDNGRKTNGKKHKGNWGKHK